MCVRERERERERRTETVRESGIRFEGIGIVTSQKGVSSASAPAFLVIFRSKIAGIYTPFAVFLDRLSVAFCISLTASQTAVSPFYYFCPRIFINRHELAIIGCI